MGDLDPLGILDADLDNIRPAELELSHYGWSERDLDKVFTLGPGILPHFATEERQTMTLREIIKTCRRIYCTSLFYLGFSFFSFPHLNRWCCRYSVYSYPGQGSV